MIPGAGAHLFPARITPIKAYRQRIAKQRAHHAGGSRKDQRLGSGEMSVTAFFRLLHSLNASNYLIKRENNDNGQERNGIGNYVTRENPEGKIRNVEVEVCQGIRHSGKTHRAGGPGNAGSHHNGDQSAGSLVFTFPR